MSTSRRKFIQQTTLAAAGVVTMSSALETFAAKRKTEKTKPNKTNKTKQKPNNTKPKSANQIDITLQTPKMVKKIQPTASLNTHIDENYPNIPKKDKRQKNPILFHLILNKLRYVSYCKYNVKLINWIVNYNHMIKNLIGNYSRTIYKYKKNINSHFSLLIFNKYKN